VTAVPIALDIPLGVDLEVVGVDQPGLGMGVQDPGRLLECGGGEQVITVEPAQIGPVPLKKSRDQIELS
jgi:hypothetical protein